MRSFFARRPTDSATLAHVILALLIGAAGATLAVLWLQARDESPQLQRVVAFALLLMPLVGLRAIRRVGGDDRLTTLATGLAIGAVAVAGLTYVGLVDKEPAAGCINTHGTIQATIAGDPTVIYRQATAASSPIGMLRRGCEIRAEAWCVGAVHEDAIEGNRVFDSRWLLLPGERGLVPYGRTVGPALDEAERDDDCPGAVERPREVNFSTAAIGGDHLLLAASAKGAAFIGFAVERGQGRWQRIGWEYEPADDVPVVLKVPQPPPEPGDDVAAVACLGYQQPAMEADAPVLQSRSLEKGKGFKTDRPSSSNQPVRQTAEDAACDASIPTPEAPYGPGDLAPAAAGSAGSP